ncbi:uncharacterized protein EV422DRAFT_539769 [Fimicolochytrium jonesii]|uniref:uncharacterized protein n=1 Tax=Fimicolochytrium jonesii TaxID=1396493 RepID=UPI0022FDC023|nr:uncharacterized protein EV422DRAFT_539769 [Fimicolochytrium jonesii]KAI8818048.1 hypothetical protein EV422DRAFT_539769 [Fimicolochytrium jonesii]
MVLDGLFGVGNVWEAVGLLACSTARYICRSAWNTPSHPLHAPNTPLHHSFPQTILPSTERPRQLQSMRVIPVYNDVPTSPPSHHRSTPPAWSSPTPRTLGFATAAWTLPPTATTYNTTTYSTTADWGVPIHRVPARRRRSEVSADECEESDDEEGEVLDALLHMGAYIPRAGESGPNREDSNEAVFMHDLRGSIPETDVDADMMAGIFTLAVHRPMDSDECLSHIPTNEDTELTATRTLPELAVARTRVRSNLSRLSRDLHTLVGFYEAYVEQLTGEIMGDILGARGGWAVRGRSVDEILDEIVDEVPSDDLVAYLTQPEDESTHTSMRVVDWAAMAPPAPASTSPAVGRAYPMRRRIVPVDTTRETDSHDPNGMQSVTWSSACSARIKMCDEEVLDSDGNVVEPVSTVPKREVRSGRFGLVRAQDRDDARVGRFDVDR